MILLLITVLMNGLGATINLQYVMDSGTEINHIHFTNVYNLEQINSNFERLQKLIYTHCVAEMIIVSAIACIVWLVVFVIIMKGIIAPLKATGQKLLEIISGINQGRGDLTVRIPVKGKDEIGQLAEGINLFIETLQKIMSSIIYNSNRLEQIVGTVSVSVNTANSNSMDISSVMEELSASMQEVSSTVANINNSATEVKGEEEQLATESDG